MDHIYGVMKDGKGVLAYAKTFHSQIKGKEKEDKDKHRDNIYQGDRIPDLHVLEQAEQSAKSKKLKIWENFAEGEVVPSGANVEAKQKEVLKVRWNV
ncbi:ribonuclease TUDOR [Trifolium repens]|nr:ribonuclease TUDOR [Trifolium repens]